MVKNMEKGNYFSLMGANILETFLIMKFQVMGNILGAIIRHKKESGKIIK
jgi:hypothetical protein